MNAGSFSLKQFPSAGLLPHAEITGNIGRRSNTLAVSYTLLAPLAEIEIPAPGDMPMRKNGLWEETCFEFFFGVKESDRYWEVNLSPAGHWNIYRFRAYRQGMREEEAIASLPFSVRIRQDTMKLSLQLELDKIIPAKQALRVAVGAVIRTMNGGMTYWALIHPGPRADFHRRDSFIVEL
jgi:hypothetical protein